ncbi:unnamed protein product [Lathyrus sativus]|nr:unnamed protein product [Lathyrus sativus]
MTEDELLWSRVLTARYGDLKHHILKGEFGARKPTSAWWKDLVNSGTVMANLGFCFAGCINFDFGDGRSVPFWTTNWCNNIPSAALFSDMYCISNTKSYCVDQRRSWSDESWNWGEFGIDTEAIRGIWNRLQSMKEFLADCRPTAGEKVAVRWMSHEVDIFTISEAYRLMANQTDPERLLDDQRKAFRCLWQIKAPSKIVVFDWKILWNRVATRDLLIKRGMSRINPNCVLCDSEVESVHHLFYSCEISSLIWENLRNWVGNNAVFVYHSCNFLLDYCGSSGLEMGLL